ncbi:4Fe-4S single cluster protein [Tepidamorphus gemmatus]|uniref:4Fe-4S single cluster protein n=1 Tax=Tepidamorphus gemmatus TaxID=747076 RepID=A0A4R3MHX5_9HYPH|nr:radical SAM protein [Tepidamorphus gemmatus]TCT12027.1 4Fe-4S single cluster protein [Tepidamorphus gemmatus]
MNDLSHSADFVPLDPRKFRHPAITAKGERRASVALKRLETLWFNTGTLCNITCANCYIESSPTNDRLAYLTRAEAAAYLDEIARLGLGTAEVGFTGGEPFMNPEILGLLEEALRRGFRVLVLTNAMQPMRRPRIATGLLRLREEHGGRLLLRISLDHPTARLHDSERGQGSFDRTVAGIDWLVANGFSIAIAGRSMWGEAEPAARAGYARLFAERGWPLDASDRSALVIFPEMDARRDVPEITTACWGILKVSPDTMMCATSRMVVKRKGAARPVVVPCTLLPYETAFEMGSSIAESLAADGGMFESGAVRLCHPHCAKFCVLGGGSCAPG